MSRETMGRSGFKTRFNDANFSMAAAIQSSPLGDDPYTYGYLKTAASCQNMMNHNDWHLKGKRATPCEGTG
jgi:hypothetical protein